GARQTTTSALSPGHNRPENGHAPLDDSHPWCCRFVACPSFKRGRSTEIWSRRVAGSRGRILRGNVRRLSTFVQTPSPSAERNARMEWPTPRPLCTRRTATWGRLAYG